MRELKFDLNSNIKTDEIDSLGGRYKFWNRLRKSTGSSKFIYVSGIEEFDQTMRGVNAELGFVNLELLKEGLVIYYNINQRLAAVGIELNEVRQIELISYRIEIRVRQFTKYVKKIVHRGELKIIDSSHCAEFRVTASQFKKIINYLSRDEFEQYFNYSISINPPEKDYGHLVGQIDL